MNSKKKRRYVNGDDFRRSLREDAKSEKQQMEKTGEKSRTDPSTATSIWRAAQRRQRRSSANGRPARLRRLHHPMTTTTTTTTTMLMTLMTLSVTTMSKTNATIDCSMTSTSATTTTTSISRHRCPTATTIRSPSSTLRRRRRESCPRCRHSFANRYAKPIISFKSGTRTLICKPRCWITTSHSHLAKTNVTRDPSQRRRFIWHCFTLPLVVSDNEPISLSRAAASGDATADVDGDVVVALG
jgi:hypothetical protein